MIEAKKLPDSVLETIQNAKNALCRLEALAEKKERSYVVSFGSVYLVEENIGKDLAKGDTIKNPVISNATRYGSISAAGFMADRTLNGKGERGVIMATRDAIAKEIEESREFLETMETAVANFNN